MRRRRRRRNKRVQVQVAAAPVLPVRHRLDKHDIYIYI
jgi:hypothetical protein